MVRRSWGRGGRAARPDTPGRRHQDHPRCRQRQSCWSSSFPQSLRVSIILPPPPARVVVPPLEAVIGARRRIGAGGASRGRSDFPRCRQDRWQSRALCKDGGGGLRVSIPPPRVVLLFGWMFRTGHAGTSNRHLPAHIMRTEELGGLCYLSPDVVLGMRFLIFHAMQHVYS